MSADECMGKIKHKPTLHLIKKAKGITFGTRINAGMLWVKN